MNTVAEFYVNNILIEKISYEAAKTTFQDAKFCVGNSYDYIIG